VAGEKGQGNRIDQLNRPAALLINRFDDSSIISEFGNRRVISNIHSAGLALDDEGSLYVSDFERHEVRRYEAGDAVGIVVVGGNDQGAALNQLNRPRHIFVDRNHSVYVSDLNNHRVMKWMKNAREGVVIPGGQGRGKSRGRLAGFS
jgi:sugar lactone lactonase YvrE